MNEDLLQRLRAAVTAELANPQKIDGAALQQRRIANLTRAQREALERPSLRATWKTRLKRYLPQSALHWLQGLRARLRRPLRRSPSDA